MPETWTWGVATGLNQRAQPLLSSDAGICLESQNIAFSQEGVCVQRPASIDQDLTGSGLTGSVEWIDRFTTNDGIVETWAAADDNGTVTVARKSELGWNPVTFSDAPVAENLRYMQSASLNGKLFICYDSDVNRLHVWDGTSLRRVGFGPATQIALSSMGAGLLSFTRYYRMRYVELSGSTVVKRSEPGPVESLMISLQAGINVTRGALLNEGETDWELEAADLEEGPYYRIATTPANTNLYQDTSATIDTTFLSPLTGSYVPPPSAKFILSDDSRLVMAGAWESTYTVGETVPKQNRLWFTPRLGTSDAGDDERIPDTVDQQNFLDANNAGPFTGLAGPLYGDIYAFKLESVQKLVSLQDATRPYSLVLVTDVIGAVDQRVICSGEQGDGIPALYFASGDTISRISQGGISDLSEPISRDLRFANLIASTSLVLYNPYSHTIFAQSNIGVSSVPGQYFQFEYDIKKERWTGAALGESGSGWIMGRSIMGSVEILGPLGLYVRNGVITQNDNGQIRLLLSGADADGDASIISLGDSYGLDGEEPYTTIVRMRRLAAPGFYFSVGAPTVIYRCPTGDSQALGKLTVEYIPTEQNFPTMRQTLKMDATNQDNPVDQREAKFSQLQMSDTTSIDVRVSMVFNRAFSSANPPSIDAVFVPISKQERNIA